MIKIKKMGSGVDLVTENIPHVSSAAVGVWIRAGAIDEKRKPDG
jgi:predicted Zn-dependent peptidase